MRLRLALCMVLVLLALPQAASAFVVGGRPWPGHRITYYNADKRMAKAVVLAVRAWNRSGVRMRFVPTSRKRAQVVIRRGDASVALPSSDFDTGACSGYSDLGWSPGRRRAHVTLDNYCVGLLVSAEVVTHELGHVLGLAHVARGCALMTPSPFMNCRTFPQAWEYRCRLVEADDLRGARRLYGGRIRAHARFCDVWSAPGAPTSLQVDPATGVVSWRNPALPKPAIEEFGTPRVEASLDLREGACGASAEFPADGVTVPMQPSAVQSVSLTPRPGVWCYTLKLNDEFGRGGSAGTTVTVPEMPPQPPPE